MLFTQGTYFVFLIAVFFAYWLIADRNRWRIIFLIAAGGFFYMQAGLRPLLLLLAVAAIDFTTTRLMAQCESRRWRRLLLIISLVIDLGALCVFKYANFFIESTARSLAFLGLTISVPHLNLIAPLGISFFVFQSVAYVVDAYRRDTEPARSFPEYLAFLSFFPTLVAGPILRAKQLLPQLRNRVTLDAETGGQALFLIAIGLVKKIAIADYLSANLVERVFDFPERFSSLEVLVAVYGYALQIYADFSGYSDIAIGSAMLLGFTLPENFNAPYRARNLPEFWRRWHISLSTWLRDYVFFTIAGRRARHAAMLYCGLIVTMLIGGLWHGPTWTFVFWGLLHGIGLAMARAFESTRKRFALPPRNTIGAHGLSVLLTFHFICLTWVLFRAESLSQAFAILGQLCQFSLDTTNLTLPAVFIIALGFIAHSLPDRMFDSMRRSFTQLPAPAQAMALFVLGLGLYFVASSDVVPFIYTRF
jgi:D-alanyl-lipoteichoic acid acyltransferase DltB (MBOAT superfamily)